MIRWNCAFIDRPTDRFETAMAFWTAVTGTRLSEPHGVDGEFVTLLPSQGDPCVRGQRVGDPGGAHLDLDVEDLDAARRHALGVGAALVADRGHFLSMRSPSGAAFCLTTGDGSAAPAPITGNDGVLSRLDQVCLNIAPSAFDREVGFWSALTGWPARPSALREFTGITVPEPLPIRILLQRKDTEGPSTGHIDIACADIDATAAWHETLGARRVSRGAHWAVMHDPTGGVYCLTGRHPVTGRLPQ
ncbi:VOC family protein [Nocardia wallacei]|uniref:VOC family protein n=1 Tax=Nocardia wallacei TaxID=480035 RepID=UPI002454BD9D|nr:VOC family protein [Nocardia wallacei]